MYGIYLLYGRNNTITGNTANDNNMYGIYLDHYCDDNIISGNTANNNTIFGIYLSKSNNNNITGNTANNNGNYGIYLSAYCDDSTISENSLYFNTYGAIIIFYPSCDTIIERNVMVSENFIIDEGTNTYIDGNIYLPVPSLCLNFVNQIFSTTEFIIIIRVFDSFDLSEILFHYDIELYYNFHIESIEMWWNGTIVPSSNITDIGHGLYKISLSPRFVEPGEDPLLLNMIISATHHSDKYFERYLAVDPEAVEKGPESGEILPLGSSGGGDDDKTAEIDGVIIILLIVGVASAIGLIGVAFFLIKKRKGIENR